MDASVGRPDVAKTAPSEPVHNRHRNPRRDQAARNHSTGFTGRRRATFSNMPLRSDLHGNAGVTELPR